MSINIIVGPDAPCRLSRRFVQTTVTTMADETLLVVCLRQAPQVAVFWRSKWETAELNQRDPSCHLSRGALQAIRACVSRLSCCATHRSTSGSPTSAQCGPSTIRLSDDQKCYLCVKIVEHTHTTPWCGSKLRRFLGSGQGGALAVHVCGGQAISEVIVPADHTQPSPMLQLCSTTSASSGRTSFA